MGARKKRRAAGEYSAQRETVCASRCAWQAGSRYAGVPVGLPVRPALLPSEVEVEGARYAEQASPWQGIVWELAPAGILRLALGGELVPFAEPILSRNRLK